jgi:Lon protease-like protein
MSEVIRVNFGKPLPLFPLPETVLLPHAIQPLHIFEPRYRKMIEDVMQSSGQIAMASFRGDDWKLNYDGNPPLRQAVCVGHVVHHDALPDGRHNILLHGVCRARIEKIMEPMRDRPYRIARLSPLEPDTDQPPDPNLQSMRKDLRQMLVNPRLSRLRCVDTVMQWFDNEEVSTTALLELIGFALVHDSELKYRLLAEASPIRRARLIRGELRNLDHLVSVADRQGYRNWPKGMSWN